MAVNIVCNVTGHEEVKQIIYSPKKCTFCKKRCFFRLRKMVKCIACKSVMHRKCASAADRSAGRRDGEVVAVVRRGADTAVPPTRFEKDVPTKRVDSERAMQLHVAVATPSGPAAGRVTRISTAAGQVMWILTTASIWPSPWLMQDVQWTWLTAASRQVLPCEEEDWTDDVAKHVTTPHGPVVIPVGPFAVTRRTVWTWSVTAGNGYARSRLSLTFDPAVGLRVLLQCVLFPPQTTGEIVEAPCPMQVIRKLSTPLCIEQAHDDLDDGCDADESQPMPLRVSRITAFEFIKMVLREKKNNEQKQHLAGGDIIKVFIGEHIGDQEVRESDIPQTLEDGDSPDDKLRELNNDKKSGSSESISTFKPLEASDQLKVSAVDSNQSTSVSYCNVSSNDKVNEKNNSAQNESICTNQQCKLNNKTLGFAGVESFARLPETSNQTAICAESPRPGPSTDHHGLQPKSSDNIPGVYEKYVNSAIIVLRNVTRDTFPMSAEMFFEILVQTNHASRYYMKRITDCIVTNAIEKPDKCAMYAELCCYVIEKAWVDSRTTVRPELSYTFKRDLIQSCRDVLTQTGVLPRVGTVRRPRNTSQSERFDAEASDRVQGTCRLMGELFVRNQLFKTVMGTVITFTEMHDVHSLECLCVLLTIIGPKLEEVIDAPRQVYEPLESYSAAGYAGDIRLPQRTIRMIDTVLSVRNGRTMSSDSRRDGLVEREIAVGSHRGRSLPQQSEDRIAAGPGILRNTQNPPSGSGGPTRRREKRVTFNPTVSILCFRRGAPM